MVIRIKASKLKKIMRLVTFAGACLFLLLAYSYFRDVGNKFNSIISYEKCMSERNKVVSSGGLVCSVYGRVFAKDIASLSDDESPVLSAEVTSRSSTTTTSAESRSLDSATTSIIDTTGKSTVTNNTFDYKSATYILEGKQVTLKNCSATTILIDELPIPSPITCLPILYNGDINSDGTSDTLFIVKAMPSTSTNLYYVLSLFSYEKYSVGSSGIYLGENIVPEGIKVMPAYIQISYRERSRATGKISNKLLTKRLSVSSTTLSELK